MKSGQSWEGEIWCEELKTSVSVATVSEAQRQIIGEASAGCIRSTGAGGARGAGGIQSDGKTAGERVAGARGWWCWIGACGTGRTGNLDGPFAARGEIRQEDLASVGGEILSGETDDFWYARASIIAGDDSYFLQKDLGAIKAWLGSIRSGTNPDIKVEFELAVFALDPDGFLTR